LFARLVLLSVEFLLNLQQAFSGSCPPRFELGPLNHSLRVGVYQAMDGALSLGELFRQRGIVGGMIRCGQASFVFLPQQLRMTEQFARIAPDGFVEFVGTNLFVLADALAAEAIRIRSHTPIVRIGDLPLRASAADAFAVIRLSTALAFQ
jgi:hypothetical protein